MKLNTSGYLGLIIGLMTLIWYLNFGPGVQKAQAQEEKETPAAAAKKFTPTEQIGVEQAVDFPVDI
jgi:hypothetical protein